jgi:DNA-binding SARP family transcriptional activator
MPASTLRLLGDFALETPSSPAPLRLGRKPRALLACVALQGSAGASRDRLISLLWPDHSDDEARGALRQCLHLLRGALGDAAEGLDSDGDHIVLRDAVFEVDVRRFETLAARSDIASMLLAADLYRGEFIESLGAGTEFATWAAAERERLRGIAQGLLTRLSESAVGTPACDVTVRLAQRLLAADPVHEGSYRALMRLHARAGLRAKALQTWNECRRVLRRELDVEPSAQTAALIEQLFGGVGVAAGAEPRTIERQASPAAGSLAGFLSGNSGDDPVVVDLLLRGWQFFTLLTAESNAKARAAFEAAVDRAGDHAEALARLGWTHLMDSLSGWSADPVLSFDLASKCASRAIACNRGHPTPHTLMSKVLLWRMEYEPAFDHLKHAADIAPSFAYPYFHMGEASMWCGRCDEALAHLSRALELDHNDHGMFLTIRGLALWMMGEQREAQVALNSAITRNPTYAWPYGGLVASYAECGELKLARDAAITARRLNRRFSLSFAEHVMPFRNPEHRRRHVEAWRAAGMPQDEAPGGLAVVLPPPGHATG